MFGKVRMLPDGFVHMSTLLAQGHMLGTSNRNISKMFRCSWMNTFLDESGTRFTIVYVPERKRWDLVHGIFEPQVEPTLVRKQRNGSLREWSLYLEQCRGCWIDSGLYIRVEGGMSQSVHCRVINDLYRSRFNPDHPDWDDVLMHGTMQTSVNSITHSGLICGGISREDND